MALAHAILALLLQSPCSGYEVTKKFDYSVGCFWKASHQQVYKELARLEAQGMVGVEVVVQENRPDKKIYTIKEQGKQYMAEWLAQPADVMAVKEELLVKLFVGYLAPPEILVKELERHRQLHADRLAFYQQIQQEEFPNLEAMSLGCRYPYLVLRRGMRYETDYIQWCEEAIAMLQTGESEKLAGGE